MEPRSSDLREGREQSGEVSESEVVYGLSAPAGGLLSHVTSSSEWILVLSLSQENIHADGLVLFYMFLF